MHAVPAELFRRIWVPCLSLFLAWGITLAPVYSRLESWALDAQQRLVAGERYFSDALVVNIDEASLDELQPYFGGWPYRRDTYALLLDYLGEAGAKTVVFDILFSDAREGDAEFRRAIARNGNAVLAASALNQPYGEDASQRLAALAWTANRPVPANHWPAVALPLAGFTETSAGQTRVGLISVVNDEDGVLRNFPLIHEIHGNYLPSLVLAALFPTGQPPPVDFQPEKNRLRVGDRTWPVNKNGSVQLQYPSNANSVLVMPLAKLARAALGVPGEELEHELFRGKTVFIGNTALFSDRLSTPRGVMNGIHVMAVAFEALLHDLVLKPQHWGWNGLLLLIALSPSLAASFRPERSVLLCAIVGVATGAVLFAVNLALFRFLRQQSWLVLPMAATLFSSLFGAFIALREEAKRRSQAAIERAAAETELALTQQRFVAMVSHEFRTPLSVIDASLQNLRQMAQGLPAEVLSRHLKIHRASQRLQTLFNNHLTQDRLRQANSQPEMAPLDIFELVARVARRAEWRGMEIALGAGQANIQGEAEMLRIAFSNLIDNAMKYSPEGGKIRVEGEILGNFVEVRIRDGGIGIAPEDLPHIFEQYFRVAGNKKGGAGLGLYLVGQIIEKHGGTISAESVLGQGTMMRVRLPVSGFPRHAV